MLALVAFLLARQNPARDATEAVELCGYGRIAPVGTIDDYPADVVAAANRAFDSIGAELRAQAAPRAQAIGLYLQMVQSVREARLDFERREKSCNDQDCIRRQTVAAAQAAAPAAQALARLAVSAADPTAYALAIYGCRLNQDGACAQLSKSHWAQLAPDNAVPWFWLAEEARARKDEPAMIRALERAALAQTSDYAWGVILEPAAHPQARALPPASRVVLLSTLIGIYSALPPPSYLPVTQFCASERLADSVRRGQCDDLASMMTERSASMLELSLGTGLGERLGWNAERVQRLGDEREAIFLLSMQGWQPEDTYSCGFVEYVEARVNDLATVGDLRAGRQRIAASGRSAGALAHEWRELQQQREAGVKSGTAVRPEKAAAPAGSAGSGGR